MNSPQTRQNLGSIGAPVGTQRFSFALWAQRFRYRGRQANPADPGKGIALSIRRLEDYKRDDDRNNYDERDDAPNQRRAPGGFALARAARLVAAVVSFKEDHVRDPIPGRASKQGWESTHE